jgi:phosphatidylserine/phosphatidylglycerophosphate/cardiolipin synthase-like enzyme
MFVVIIAAGCSSKVSQPKAQALSRDPVSMPQIESPLLNYARYLSASSPEKNSVALLETGSDALLSRIHLIRSATDNISIQTLIWANDEVGRLFMYELIKAAQRGVEVRFLIDHLSSEQHVEFVTYLANAHPYFKIKLFNPVESIFNQPKAKSFFWEKLYALVFKFNRFNHRMHNKTFLVDDLVAITGGRNYQNAYYDHAGGMNYKDRDILAVGPVVKQMYGSFDEYWDSKYAVSVADLHDVKKSINSGSLAELNAREDFFLNGLYRQVNNDLNIKGVIRERFIDSLRAVEDAYFVADSPRKRDRILIWFGGDSKITSELADVVSGATESVYIQTPYLILTSPAISLFNKIRKQNPELDVRVSTNSLAATDSWHVYAMSYQQKQTYLQNLKFKIYEFKPLPGDMDAFMPNLERLKVSNAQLGLIRWLQGEEGKVEEPYMCLHGKSMVVDDRISFVGSYNLDPRSENINTEAGVFIRDRYFAKKLRSYIENDMRPDNSWAIARKKRMLGLDYPNAIIAKLSHLIPFVDVWPFRYSASFELISGKQPVENDHPDFYEHYEDVGSFPQINMDNFGKELGARGTKAFLSFVKPLL